LANKISLFVAVDLEISLVAMLNKISSKKKCIFLRQVREKVKTAEKIFGKEKY